MSSNTNVTYYNYNAFLQGAQQPAYEGSNNIIVTNYNWQTSMLGSFYLPTSSPLIDMGSTNANLLGLYHFTTQTNQVKETNSIVDIGYHYVAVNGSSNPLDFNSDGIPDYLEDANGNGSVDSGEMDWTDPDVDYDGRSSTQELTDGTDPLNPNSVLGVQLGFWRFNDTHLLGGQSQVALAVTDHLSVDDWTN